MHYAALGLDVGRKRIGVAGCDRLGITVHGITTIIRKSWQDDMAELRSLNLRSRRVIYNGDLAQGRLPPSNSPSWVVHFPIFFQLREWQNGNRLLVSSRN